MGLTLVDKALWLVSLAGQLTLLIVLVSKKRLFVFPWFTAFIAFGVVQSAIDFIAYRTAGRSTYFWTYTSLTIVDVMLQLAVVLEMARIVLRSTGTWIHDARTLFVGLGIVGALLAIALSFAVSPEAPSSLYAWTIRIDLFTSLLIAELVVAMSFAAQRLGLQWRNWVMGEGQGLMLWISISLGVDTAHSYFGWTRDYIVLDRLSIFAFIGALGYWSVVFWRIEPERRPLSPEMVQYLVSIHKNLDYDLRSISGKK